MRYYRTKHEDAIYHITTRCNNQEKLFSTEIDSNKYLAILSSCKNKLPFLLHNYTIMQNHVHLLIRPIEPANISRIMQAINRQYAQWYNAYHSRKGHFWETRFDSVVIADDKQLLAVMRYIDLNAVRANLCESPAEWKYSGSAYYINGIHNALLDAPDTYSSLGPSDALRRQAYKAILAIPI